MIGSLQINALLPQAEIKALDDSYQAVLEELRGFDPKVLIIDVVEPQFEAAIEPFLNILLALSDLIDALLERLRSLESELNSELARTSDAFVKMLQALPLSGGGASASVSVSV